jgi:hypothetical protein
MNRDVEKYGRTPHTRIRGLLEDYENSLPEACYSADIITHEVVLLQRGEKGYYTTNWGAMKDYETALSVAKTQNDAMEITPEQYDAMFIGSMRGFGSQYANPDRDYGTRLYLLGQLPVFDDFEDNTLAESLGGVGMLLSTGEDFIKGCGRLDSVEMQRLNNSLNDCIDGMDGLSDIEPHHIVLCTEQNPSDEIYVFRNPKEACELIGYLSYYNEIPRDERDYAKGEIVDRRYDFSGVTKDFGMDDEVATASAYEIAAAVQENDIAAMQDIMLGRIENAYNFDDHTAVKDALYRYYTAANPVSPQYDAFIDSVADATIVPAEYLRAIDLTSHDYEETGGMELK